MESSGGELELNLARARLFDPESLEFLGQSARPPPVPVLRAEAIEPRDVRQRTFWGQ